MFCSNCGKKLKVNSNFCEFCGHEVKKIITEEKAQSKGNTRKKKVFILGAIVIAVVMISSVFVMEMNRVTTKNKALEDAMLFMEEKEYESAIEAFDKAFAEGDNDPQHYLLQAKAYVESGDLYGAQQTLQLGYANTKSEDLLYVEIWGPRQPFDILISLSDDDLIPNVRQKFVFAGNDIEAQYYFLGRVMFTNKYYYDENGQLVGCQMYMYDHYVFGAEDPLYLCSDAIEHCIPLRDATSIFLCFDFTYPQSDRVEVWSWNSEIDSEEGEIRATEQELFATLYYENGRCVSMVSEDGTSTLSYDENGRIVELMNAYGDKMLVGYSEQGDYVISKNYAEEVFKFDSNGLNIAYYGDLVEEEWRVETENDKITEIYCGEELVCCFSYDEKGRILKAEANNGENERTVTCTYNPYSDEEELSMIELTDVYGETVTRLFNYDKEGRISEISQGNDTIRFSYDENGRCTSYTWNQEQVFQIIYDDLGRVLDVEFQ